MDAELIGQVNEGLTSSEPPEPTRVALVVPFDFALDAECWRWTHEPVSLHVTRTPFVAGRVGVELAEAVSDERSLSDAARALTMIEPAVTSYACTSGSFVGGLAREEKLRRALKRGGARIATTTSGSLLMAMRQLGINRVAVATPYSSALTRRLVDFLDEAGQETTSVACLGIEGHIWEVKGEAVRELVRSADNDAAQAVFISCTNLRTYDEIELLERELNKPVLAANQVTIWAALMLAGVSPRRNGQRLFDELSAD